MSLFTAEAMTQVRKTAHEAAEFEAWMARQVDDNGELADVAAEKAADMRAEIDVAVAKIVALVPERSPYDIAAEIAAMAANGADNAVGLLAISRLIAA